MKTKNGNIYHELRKLWKEAFPQKSKKLNDEVFQKFWNENKPDQRSLLQKQNELKLRIQARGKPILSAIGKLSVPRKPPPINNTNNKEDGVVEPPVVCLDNDGQSKTMDEIPPEEPQIDTLPSTESQPEIVAPRQVRDTPAQKKIREELEDLRESVDKMEGVKDLLSREKLLELKQLKKTTAHKVLQLKRLKACQKASHRFRERKKRIIQRALASQPELQAQILNPYPGRPRVERDQPELMDAIINIVNINASASEKRRSDQLRCVKTLDNLLMELQLLGYNISRSGLYLRLLPRNCSTIEGKLHTKTVPVKLKRPENNLRKDHEDAHFAAAQIKHLKDLAGCFGGENVFVLSQDDKARVPLGIPAATRQGPLLMRMDYPVRLPDHDWVVASRHKLIPSVYAGLEIKNSLVTYSGPTYIAIRSGKHDSSTAHSHAIDMHRLLNLDLFKNFAKDSHEEIKPIWIILVDGGPDENPRYPKTLRYAAEHFKRFNLDAIFVATHAPHHSAFNPVERRMAPLSRDLVGLILPHDSYGNHLDTSGRTVDHALEIQNFRKAGEMLGNVWSQRVIDNYEVFSEYIDAAGSGSDSIGTDSATCVEPAFLTEVWKCKHVQQSQYMLQITKCDDVSCCGTRRTQLMEFLKSQFLPSPVKITNENGMLKISTDGTGSFMDLASRICLDFLVPNSTPFDFHCPTVAKSLKDRVCPVCKKYFPSKKGVKDHKKIHSFHDNASIDSCLPLTSVETQNEDRLNPAGNEDTIFQIQDLSTWFRLPFAELE